MNQTEVTANVDEYGNTRLFNIARRTFDLLKIRSVSTPPSRLDVEKINSCIDYITKDLDKNLGYQVHEYVNDAGINFKVLEVYFNGYKDNRDGGLLMFGHVDVVDGTDEQFKPFFVNNSLPEEKVYDMDKIGELFSSELYGRGAKDMKSGVSVQVEIMNALAVRYAKEKEQNNNVKVPNVRLLIEPDEEIGSFNGLAKYISEYKPRPDIAWTADPARYHGIVVKEKGAVRYVFDIAKKGKALGKAFDLYRKIRDEWDKAKWEMDGKTTAKAYESVIYKTGESGYVYSHSLEDFVFGFELPMKTDTESMSKLDALRAYINHMGNGCRLDVERKDDKLEAKVHIKGQPNHASRTFLSECAFEKAADVYEHINSLFSDAVFRYNHVSLNIDLRFSEKRDYTEIENWILKLMSKEEFSESVDMVKGIYVPPAYTSENHANYGLIENFQSAVNDVENNPVRLISSCGASTARLFSEMGIPFVNYGQKGDGHHSNPEYVVISSLQDVFDAGMNFVTQYLGK